VRIRVVTLNLLHGAPIPGRRHARVSLKTRLAWTSEHLAGERPDVVLLQEASASARQENTAAILARNLGMGFTYARANPSPLFRLAGIGRLSFEEGPAVLSRLPIVAHRVHRLSSVFSVFERRLALEAVLEGPEARFSVFSVHLSARSAADRRRQIAQLIREVEATPHAHPVIVGGDFNAEERSHEIRLLTDVKGWIDSFRHLNREAAGYTWGQALTSATATAGSRIDFLFSVPSRDERWEPSHSRLILDRSFPEGRAGVLWASDHYGVLGDFEAPSSRRNSSE
jgi:endonuclease/exonuclease/phosphatase family metal-dependent hydrolase